MQQRLDQSDSILRSLLFRFFVFSFLLLIVCPCVFQRCSRTRPCPCCHCLILFLLGFFVYLFEPEIRSSASGTGFVASRSVSCHVMWCDWGDLLEVYTSRLLNSRDLAFDLYTLHFVVFCHISCVFTFHRSFNLTRLQSRVLLLLL